MFSRQKPTILLGIQNETKNNNQKYLTSLIYCISKWRKTLEAKNLSQHNTVFLRDELRLEITHGHRQARVHTAKYDACDIYGQIKIVISAAQMA